MKVRNKRIYSTNKEYLVTLREEYIMLGFSTSLEPGCLTVHSTRRRAPQRNRKNKSGEPTHSN